MPPIEQNNNGTGAPAGTESPFDLSSLFPPGGSGLPSDDVDDNPTDDDQQNAGGADDSSVDDDSGAPPAQPRTDDAAAALQRHNETLAEAVRALAGRANAPAQPAQPAVEDQPRVWVSPEMIPAPMLALLNSEDPAERTRGLAAFGQALAMSVYASIQKDVQDKYQPQFQEYVNQYYAQERAKAEWKAEMDRDYPVLTGSPQGQLVGRGAIEETSRRLLAEGVPAQQIAWGHPKFKTTFNAVLKEWKINPKGVAAAPAQPAAPGGNGGNRGTAPARVSRGGARPADPSGRPSSQVDSMLDVLGTAYRGPR